MFPRQLLNGWPIQKWNTNHEPHLASLDFAIGCSISNWTDPSHRCINPITSWRFSADEIESGMGRNLNLNCDGWSCRLGFVLFLLKMAADDNERGETLTDKRNNIRLIATNRRESNESTPILRRPTLKDIEMIDGFIQFHQLG